MATGRQLAIQPTDRSALAAATKHAGLGDRISDAILSLIAAVPDSTEPISTTPEAQARIIAERAARIAAGISGGAAMAPGPLGLLTLLPDLVAVWRVQSQLVADIGSVYGKDATLTKEQMLYCLFKHTASHVTRDLVMRAGERFLVQRPTGVALQAMARKIGIKVAQKTIGKAFARWAPIVGAIGVGGYAYYDTKKVAANAIELFSGVVVMAEGD
jgi:hypothetical protein